MKKSRILISTLLIISIVFANVSVLGFRDVSDVVVGMQIGNPMMTVNENNVEIDTGRGTAPMVINNRTLVPIRAIIEAFGGTVEWNDSTNQVTLELEGNTIKLVIDSNTGYINGTPYSLDVAPTTINDRTMLPIRFVAEGFNLGVAWDEGRQLVSVVREYFDQSEYDYLMANVPYYSGSPYAVLNNNVPFFKGFEKIYGSFEYYAYQDGYDRCDVCFASVAPDIMPTEERGSISSVTPTGWLNKKYDTVSGGYLYNRCHLIGFQLTGENANTRNLITGTRYLNIDGMLPFENQVANYVKSTGNHVLYRVTPFFKWSNLVADGVLMEALSLEDNGKGISYCVFCYNVQPTIGIDYATGNSWQEAATVAEPTTTGAQYTESSNNQTVYTTKTGKKYHNSWCNYLSKSKIPISLSDAKNSGLTPCSKCNPPQ